MNEHKKKALELFEMNLSRFFNAELSEEKNRLTAKANTIFWVKKIIGILNTRRNDYMYLKQIEEWQKILKEVEQIKI